MFLPQLLTFLYRRMVVQNIDESIGKKLRENRVEAQASLETIAHFLEISARELGRIERGSRPASASQLFKLGSYFGVPVATFFYSGSTE